MPRAPPGAGGSNVGGSNSSSSSSSSSSKTSAVLTTIPSTIPSTIAIPKPTLTPYQTDLSQVCMVAPVTPGEAPVSIKIQNMTATINLGVELDLKTIAMTLRNTDFNPKKFSGCILRLLDPKCTALLFPSGKCVIMGVKTVHNATLATKKFGLIISKCGFQVKNIAFKIENVVATFDCKFPIRLEGLAFEHQKYSSYEPELFPGLIYRMINPKLVFLVFVSGKVCITGARSHKDILSAVEKIFPVFLKFKKLDLSPQGLPTVQRTIAAGETPKKALEDDDDDDDED